ncbi:MAG TPA: rhodanese-like domain-containing protein [Lachnospiraceae bacterium]|nr:rhodanese-like domain-containing protein [Lachnospiraceae bacterium]HEX3076228.1 rhodanese-like domain-containing protein [Lachnospiraceae bacterium]
MKKTIVISSILFLAFVSIIYVFVNLVRKADTPTYHTISANQAKEMIDQNPAVTVLDVRTEEEYVSGHIENAILLPYDAVPQLAEHTLPDKSATILIYCRSGRRSKVAANSLAELGYTDIYDFGGINDWPYTIVTE